MDRRAFLKASGVAAGSAAVGFGVASRGTNHEVVAAEELDEGVEILTDEYGVSHIYAEELYEVAYGQGWAQARDRLFQMDLFRLIGRGESAKAIGPDQLASDIEVKRDLYNDEELEQMWAEAAEDTRTAIKGYTDGVNDQMDRLKARGELPGEFTLLAREPEAWKPTDTVATLSYLIGFFGVSGGSERGSASTLLEMFEHVGDGGAFESEREAFAAYHDLNSIVVPDHHMGAVLPEEIEPTDERALRYGEISDAQWEAIRGTRDTEAWGIEESSGLSSLTVSREPLGMLSDLSFGSNGIVVSGEHTETGDAMLAGGPQMSLLKPPVIHEIGLHGAEFDVVGIGVVGTPGIVIGRTDEFAWTVTSAGDDAIDTIAVDLDPDDHDHYRWDGEWHEFTTETYTHKPNAWAGLVGGNPSIETVEQEVAYVEQAGTKMPVVAYNEDEDIAYVERVATRMEELDGAFMWAEVGRKDDREGFEESLSDFPFGFNFLYMDSEDIAHYRTAKIPDRNHDGDPRFPMPPDEHEWTGFDTGLDIGASAVNPRRGFAVNWNNAPAPGWRNSGGEFGWDGAHRVDVLDRLTREAIVRTDDALSVADIEGIELPEGASGNLSLSDVEDIIEDCSVEQPFAPQIVPHIVAAVRETDDDRLHAVADELERWAGADDVDRWPTDTLERWFETEYPFRPGEDGRYPTGGVAIYEELRHELNSLLYEDTLGDAAPRLEYNPRAGDALSGGVDPHAADHGSGGNPSMHLIDAIDGRTTFEWLADYSGEFALINGAGEALELDAGTEWWEWLWGSDDIVRAAPGGGSTQLFAPATGQSVDDGTACRLQSADSGQALALDGEGDGATLVPTDDVDDGAAIEFCANGDGTYRLCAEEDLVLGSDGSDGVALGRWEDRADQRWTLDRQAETTRAELFRTALSNAADRLEDRFDSDDPSEWRQAAGRSEFFPLGGAELDTVPMSNRASYQQAIAIGEGEGSERDLAKSVLPPSNSGHMNTWELIAAQFGQEPSRLTDQLDLYANFDYKPHPITREAVEERTIDERDMD